MHCNQIVWNSSNDTVITFSSAHSHQPWVQRVPGQTGWLLHQGKGDGGDQGEYSIILWHLKGTRRQLQCLLLIKHKSYQNLKQSSLPAFQNTKRNQKTPFKGIMTHYSKFSEILFVLCPSMYKYNKNWGSAQWSKNTQEVKKNAL